MRLEQQNAIVTGAGSGIGKATAAMCANEGAAVFCIDLKHGIQNLNRIFILALQKQNSA